MTQRAECGPDKCPSVNRSQWSSDLWYLGFSFFFRVDLSRSFLLSSLTREDRIRKDKRKSDDNYCLPSVCWPVYPTDSLRSSSMASFRWMVIAHPCMGESCRTFHVAVRH